MKYCLKIGTVLCFAIIAGCGGARIAYSRNTGTSGKPISKIMVIAFDAPQKSEGSLNLEESLADHLCYLGYEAIAGGDSYFMPADEKATMNKIRSDSVDAIMTISLLDWRIEREEMPEDLLCSPYNNYNRLFWCYQAAILKKINAEGYYRPGKKYIWEFNFYDAEDQRLLHCVRTKSVPYHQSENDIKEIFDLVIADMVWSKTLQVQH